jgi:hypothetical protein
MDVTPYLEAVRSDLENVAGSEEATLAVAERLARALEPSLQLRLLDALSQAAQEVSDQLPAGRIEVRLSGRDVHLVFAGEETPEAAAPDDDTGTARLTLRMPEGLKARVEQQAGRDGTSTNAWLVRAITRALEHPRRVGNRLTGYAQT